jgi:hypothetical protein
MLGFLVTFCLKPILRSVFEKPNPIAGSFLTRAPLNEAPEPSEPSPSWIACSSIDHIWDDPFNNYHPAQTLGNPQTIYKRFIVVFVAFQMAGLNG